MCLFSDISPFSSVTNVNSPTITAGQAATFTLPKIDSYPEAYVTWYNVINDQNNQLSDDRYFVTQDKKLVILETTINDNSRIFRAKASNPYIRDKSKEIWSGKFYLHVQGKFLVCP